ncbi:transmembrane channel-like protein 7 isoform X2 [Amia ocellicauda]|uniref:transmembrane channel-like protein 7 isoform X2 n=1 Tax=Amia ocellicauda TaxID=2972642 RepID=UPI0034639CCD
MEWSRQVPQWDSVRSRRTSLGVGAREPPGPPRSPSPSAQSEQGDTEGVQMLRELPLPMGLKRAVRQVRDLQVPAMSSRWQSWLRSQNTRLRRLQEEAGELLGRMQLWRKPLETIGGQFGGGVQSYFLFLRFLVLLNFLSFTLIAAFVLIPNLALPINNTDQYSSNASTGLCRIYDPTPEGLVDFYSYILDLLSGTGFMELSVLFYGWYGGVGTAGVVGGWYNVPVAFLLTSIFYLLFCLCCIIARSGSAVRVAVMTGGGTVGGYSLQVFTGWDHRVTGERDTQLKHSSITYQLQVELEEETRRRVNASRSALGTAALYSVRLLLNILVLGLIGGAFYCIHRSTVFSQSFQYQDNFFLNLLVEYLPSIVITAANFVVPTLCDIIARLEGHGPTTQIILSLLRSVFLRLASLGVLLASLWSQITCKGGTDTSNCRACGYNYKQYPCWETTVGQEMYKLVIFDFLIVVAVLLLVEFPRWMVVDYCPCSLARWLGRQEFSVPQCVLGLVYGQMVVWTGAFYCPLLPLINTVKFIIFFYCRRVSLSLCRPAQRTFRSTSSSFFFLLVLLLGLCVSCVPLGCSLGLLQPSQSCGPFRSLRRIWDALPDSFSSLHPTLRSFLLFLGTQAFAVPLFLLSSVALCSTVAVALAYSRSVSLLRTQLKLEGRDKLFLVKQIAELSSANQKSAAPRGPSGIALDNWDSSGPLE